MSILVKDQSNTPIGEASITIGSNKVTADTNGMVHVQVTSGVKTLTITKSGYETLVEVIDVTSQVTITKVLIARPQPIPTYSVIVKVLDSAQSSPVIEAAVSLGDIAQNTDSSGMTKFTVIAGTYTLSVGKSGYTNVSESVDVSDNSTLQLNLSTIPKELPPTNSTPVTHSIIVNVHDLNTSELIADVALTIGGVSAMTNSTGSASFQLPAGAYSLTMSKTGYISASEAVTISADITLNRNLGPEPILKPNSYAITVIVSDKETMLPITESIVQIDGLQNKTKTNGVAVLNIGAGSYTLSISKSGYITTTESILLSENVVINRNLVRVIPPITKYAVIFSIHDAGSLKSLGGVAVSMGSASTKTNTVGSASFQLPSGTYTLTMSKTGYTSTSESIQVSGNVTLVRTLTQVPPVVTKYNIVVNVHDAGSLQVLVGATIGMGGLSATTNTVGSASFQLPSGTYTLTMSKTGYTSTSEAVVVSANVTLNRNLTLEPQSPTDVYRVVVSLDGSGDFKDIQQAINSVPAGKKGDIYIKAGTYLPPYRSASDSGPGAYIYLKSNLYIHGDGMGKTVLQRGASFGVMSGLDLFGNTIPLTNIIIEDITLNGMSGPDVTKIMNGYGSGINLSHNRPYINTGIVIRRVESINFGAGFQGRNVIGTDFEGGLGLLMEGCHTSNGWTSMTFLNSAFLIVRNNRFEKTAGDRYDSTGVKIGTGGDAVFPQATTSYLPAGTTGLSHDWIIQNNYIFDIGDTGFDPTTATGSPFEYNFLFEGNTMVNAWIRGSGSMNVIIRNNVFYDDPSGTYKKAGIGFDSGKGRPLDILIEGNTITCTGTTRLRAISLVCADSGSQILGIDGNYRQSGTIVRNNTVTMLSGTAGIGVGSIGSILLEGNIISGPSSYGVDFAGWGGLSISKMMLQNNKISGFKNTGVWDNDVSKPNVTIQFNQIKSTTATYAVDVGQSKWIITNNGLTSGIKTGNNALLTGSGSTVTGNTASNLS